MLEFCHLSAGYGRKAVLREVSATLAPGELLVIAGPNGCGKSTLLKSVLSLTVRFGGEILLDGREVAAMDRRVLAGRLAYLPQERAIPPLTALELVLHGRYPHLRWPGRYSRRDVALARDALGRLGGEDWAQLPLAELSGGMRQRVYLAMALAQGSDYILLDEPAAHLDAAGQLELLRLLRELARQGMAIGAVMHELPLALPFAHRVLVMQEGRGLGCFSPGELVENGLMRQVFGLELGCSGQGEFFWRQDVVDA